MRVAVIGAGNIGGTLGARWKSEGHEVIYGLREPSKKDGARSIGEAIGDADVVLLAVPAGAVVDVVSEHAPAIGDKVVIDATNNFRAASFHHWTEIGRLVPRARLYRAFNTLGWDVFADPLIGGEQADLFYAGPEGGDLKKVETLIADAGLRPVWVGGPEAVDVVDGVLKLWFTLAQRRGRRIAFKLLTE